MAGFVIASCILLFRLDEETHSFSDLVAPGNLIVLIVYILPTYLLCLVLFLLFNRAYSPGKSAVRAMAIGIPPGLILVMCFFWWTLKS